MLDITTLATHPDVEIIWNMFPFFYVFPYFIRVILNFLLFIPDIFLRPIWFIWNSVTGSLNSAVLIATLLLNF